MALLNIFLKKFFTETTDLISDFSELVHNFFFIPGGFCGIGKAVMQPFFALGKTGKGIFKLLKLHHHKFSKINGYSIAMQRINREFLARRF